MATLPPQQPDGVQRLNRAEGRQPREAAVELRVEGAVQVSLLQQGQELGLEGRKEDVGRKTKRRRKRRREENKRGKKEGRSSRGEYVQDGLRGGGGNGMPNKDTEQTIHVPPLNCDI